jgi:hypothetical protein
MTQERKSFLKWIVPKLSGAAVLLLTAIQSKGKLPHTLDDWAWISIGVGLGFSSHSKQKFSK